MNNAKNDFDYQKDKNKVHKIRRELNEDIISLFVVLISPISSISLAFLKKFGNKAILIL
jgi:hypothetical protein